jgi:hypothetical protein
MSFRAPRRFTHHAGDFRVVQLTPPGSACSISFGSFSQGTEGSVRGLHLVVDDIEAARAELMARGLDASEIFHYAEGGQMPGLRADDERENPATSKRSDKILGLRGQGMTYSIVARER